MSIPVWGGVSLGPTGQKLKRIIDAYPGDKRGLYVTSAYRPGDRGHHGGLTYGGSPTAAIDIGFGYGTAGYQTRARNFAAWLYQFSNETVELIVSKVGSPNANGGYYVKNQRRVSPYAHTGGNTSIRHEDHVHFATSSSLADRIMNRIGSGGSGGGTLPPPPSGTPQAVVAVTPYHQRPTIRQGASGGPVGHLQFLLRDRLGYRIDRVGGSPFGPQTDAAVRDFQGRHSHLQNDGVVGASTWAQIEVAAHHAVSGKPSIRRGSSGGWVGFAQHCLRKAGFTIGHVQGFPFGPQTHNAMVAFQRRYPWLQNNGVVGPQTRVALAAVERGQTPKDPRDSGGSPQPTPLPQPLPPPPSGETPPPSQGSGNAVTPGSLLALRDIILRDGGGSGLSGVQFAGIGPAAPSAYGYHNSRARHQAGLTTTGSRDYSIQVSADKDGNPNHFSAIDLSREGPTRVMTARLRDAVARRDPRLQYIREFYGSLDNRIVFGRIHDSENGPWRSASADNSHLWHVHISFFRRYANNITAINAVADVLLGR